MIFDNPYAAYVLTAYGISGAMLSLMALRSWCCWRKAQKAWKIAKILNAAGELDT